MSKSSESTGSNEQSWPSFVDILSAVVLVLCFAILILIIVLTITRITSSVRQEEHETSPSSFRIESEVLGDYRAEFQRLTIVANPSLTEQQETDSEAPTVENIDSRPIYVPEEQIEEIEDPQEILERGDSEQQVIGDIPRTVDVDPIEVLEELIIVQRDVIEQQRKVIEQQEEEIHDTVREYQSLLSIVTEEREVEDVRQEIVPTPDVANFFDLDTEGEIITGDTEDPSGQGSMFLSPPENTSATIDIESQGEELLFTFNDNAPFLTENGGESAREAIQNNIESYAGENIVLETKVTDYAISGAEAQRIAVERLLIFRSLLVDAGIDPSFIRLRTVNNSESSDDTNPTAGLNYGWVVIKRDE